MMILLWLIKILHIVKDHINKHEVILHIKEKEKMYAFTSRFANVVLKIFGRTKVINKNKLPKDTGYVVACSHIGWVDVVALGTSLLPNEIHFMAKKSYLLNLNQLNFL